MSPTKVLTKDLRMTIDLIVCEAVVNEISSIPTLTHHSCHREKYKYFSKYFNGRKKKSVFDTRKCGNLFAVNLTNYFMCWDKVHVLRKQRWLKDVSGEGLREGNFLRADDWLRRKQSSALPHLGAKGRD